MNMSFTTSFTFNDEFRDILKETAVKNGKSQTKLIEEAVLQYRAGSLPESDLINRLDSIIRQNTEFQTSVNEKISVIEKSIVGIDTLIKLVLKNQQTGDNTGKQ